MSEPYARLFYNGADITGDIEGDVLSLDWTDNLHGKADELAVKLADADGKWRGPWRPQKGDMVAATIGDLGGPSIDCGTFEIDIPEAGGNRSGDHLSFKAVSAPHSAALRSQQSGTDEDTDLRRIIARRAGRNGLGITGSIDAVPFAYKRQRRERDLAFVKRLAEDYGHFVSIKSRQLVFYRRDELEAAGAVRTFELADLARFTDWSATEQQHGTYATARCRYLDPDSKELVEAEATDGRIANANELLVDERVETKAQAERLTRGRLAKANEDARTAELTVIGDPILVAGNVVALGGTFGGYAGRYLIHCARHSIKRASWTVKLELKGV